MLAKLRLAVNGWARDSEALFINATAWGKTAENVASISKKGSRVVVHGRLESQSWEKDGVKRTSYEISASDVQVLDVQRADGGAVQADSKLSGTDEDVSFGKDPDDDVPF